MSLTTDPPYGDHFDTRQPPAMPVSSSPAQLRNEMFAGRWGLSSITWATLLIGVLLVADAYSVAATVLTGQTHFQIFWLGIMVFTLPAALRLMRANIHRHERLCILIAFALFYFLPKFLRDPSYPLFHDELAHWRQAEVIYATGTLFQPNPTVEIVPYFPGLHALTVALRELSGLSTFAVGTIILLVVHVICLVGIFIAAEQMGCNARIAGLAALLYSFNPSYMFFDVQFSYESLAIVYFVWIIAAVAAIQRTADNRSRQHAWFIVGLILAAGIIVTHHISTYILDGLLLVIAGITTIQAKRGFETQRTAWLTAIFSLVIIIGSLLWLVFIASKTIGYLGPNITGGFIQLLGMIRHEQSGRVLFAGSTTPIYERVSAYLSPVIAAIGCGMGLWLLWHRRANSSVHVALALFALLYFPSVLFILTPSGNEGARRSWAFTYIGLCVVLAPAISWWIDRLHTWRVHARRAAHAALAIVLGVVCMGNVTMHLNETYRFPGAYIYGTDTRTLNAELIQTVNWFRTTQGINHNIVADRYTGLGFSAFGQDWISGASGGFPVWELYFNTTLASDFLLRELQQSHYTYMVTDQNMTRYLPRIGVYFEPDEILYVQRTAPPPAAALAKYNNTPWTIKIYQSNNLAIYRYNFAALRVRGT